jgi:lipoprotein-releasing system ATP-binding protein
MRGMHIGFIYQFHNLLSDFTAMENVMMPKIINGFSTQNAQAAATSILKGIGLQHRINHLPGSLSGGEQQRVAIARALVNKPNLILADEPTGNLDPENSKFVFNLLISAVRNLGSGCILVTHNLSLTENADRVLTFKERKLIEI